MNMKRFSIISLLLWIGILAFALGKPKVMWLDCSANFQRFSYPDSIRFYVDKCHEAGITHLVLDIKDNTGEVLYPSKYAAQTAPCNGNRRKAYHVPESGTERGAEV